MVGVIYGLLRKCATQSLIQLGGSRTQCKLRCHSPDGHSLLFLFQVLRPDRPFIFGLLQLRRWIVDPQIRSATFLATWTFISFPFMKRNEPKKNLAKTMLPRSSSRTPAVLVGQRSKYYSIDHILLLDVIHCEECGSVCKV